MTDANEGECGPNGSGARPAAHRAGTAIDELHVECIRAALARGEYVIDARRLAGRLLQFERWIPD